MKIKKISEDITYKAESAEIVVEINGKPVQITDWYKHDNLNSNYDQDTEIDERDKEKLTEDEEDALLDYIRDIRELKEGEDIDL